MICSTVSGRNLAERIGHMSVRKQHPNDKHSSFSSGDVETDRNAVVMVEPFAQLVQGISEFPADKFDLDLVHRLALLGIRYSRSYSITTADSGLTRCSPELRRLLMLALPKRGCKAGGYCAVGTIRLQNRTVPAVGTMLDWANLR